MKNKLLTLLLCAFFSNVQASERDPLESFNRSIFSFNEIVDQNILKPIAKTYEQFPDPIRIGVGNFFGNIGDLWIGTNNLLQGKPLNAVSDIGRMLINSTIGIVGLFDVASEIGLEKHSEDFGQTLGKWGVCSGPYLVLPILGPKTVRDTAGTVVDFIADPVTVVDPISTRNILFGSRAIHERTELLPTDKIIDEAALDKYSYVRDAYISMRESKIRDGEPLKFVEESEVVEVADQPLTLKADPSTSEEKSITN